MTTHAQISSAGRPRSKLTRSRGERPTRGLRLDVGIVTDPLALLDLRTRQRAIAPADAEPGRHLALEHDGDTLLIALDRAITRVGRGLAADLRIEDIHVSRRHAIVAQAEDPEAGVNLLDDRSVNGTFVNGQRVTAQRLRDGDVIRVGRVVFRFVELATARRPASPGDA